MNPVDLAHFFSDLEQELLSDSELQVHEENPDNTDDSFRLRALERVEDFVRLAASRHPAGEHAEAMLAGILELRYAASRETTS